MTVCIFHESSYSKHWLRWRGPRTLVRSSLYPSRPNCCTILGDAIASYVRNECSTQRPISVLLTCYHCHWVGDGTSVYLDVYGSEDATGCGSYIPRWSQETCHDFTLTRLKCLAMIVSCWWAPQLRGNRMSHQSNINSISTWISVSQDWVKQSETPVKAMPIVESSITQKS